MKRYKEIMVCIITFPERVS